ncbi:hypothetical protein GCM10017673_13570 [Streptosporangium violaceochromogenes]|nr:hypothetical protein GCM10017673_13570 [Streptosporangium violaceochromogenes]
MQDVWAQVCRLARNVTVKDWTRRCGRGGTTFRPLRRPFAPALRTASPSAGGFRPGDAPARNRDRSRHRRYPPQSVDGRQPPEHGRAASGDDGPPVVAEGVHARFRQGKTVGEGFERVGGAVPTLIERARRAPEG